MTAALEHVAPPRIRQSGMERRRRARAAVHAASRAVELMLGMKAAPGPGEERLPGRAIACHVAREAFRIPTYEIAMAARVDRRTASSATFRLWDRRDADPELETRIDMVIAALRAMAEDPSVARAARMAGSSNTLKGANGEVH